MVYSVTFSHPALLPFCVQRQILQYPPKNICNTESKAGVNFTIENSDFVTLLNREDVTLKALVQRPKPLGHYDLEEIEMM